VDLERGGLELGGDLEEWRRSVGFRVNSGWSLVDGRQGYLLPDHIGKRSLRRHGGIGPGSSCETERGSAQHWAISETGADFRKANPKVVWLSSATASGNQSPAESVGQASARGRANEGGSRPYDPCNQSAARAHSVGRSKGVPHATLPRSPRSHAPRKKTHGPAGGNSGQLFRRRRHPTGHCAISPTYTAVPCSTIEKFADCPGSDPGKEIGAVPRCWTAAESGPFFALWPIHGFLGTSSPAREAKV
jgi:hypothetical protein